MNERDTHVVLKTPRLRIRQFTPDDANRLFDLNSDPTVMRFLGPAPSLETLRDEIIPFHLAVYQRFDRLGTWAAEERATGEFLGWFHFRAGPGEDTRNIDIGYRMRRATWNKGYATEGSAALIHMGFAELGVERVFAHTMTVNAASRRVMEKCGLTLVRTTPYDGPGPVEGAEHGQVEYALTRAEWEAYAASGTK
jgi:RimJ/RimL family protein N-acetyltransferase